MNVKTSKEVTDRQKACVFLQSVFSLQGPSVATSLTELFRRQFKDGEEPDYASAILGFARQPSVHAAGCSPPSSRTKSEKTHGNRGGSRRSSSHDGA